MSGCPTGKWDTRGMIKSPNPAAPCQVCREGALAACRGASRVGQRGDHLEEQCRACKTCHGAQAARAACDGCKSAACNCCMRTACLPAALCGMWAAGELPTAARKLQASCMQAARFCMGAACCYMEAAWELPARKLPIAACRLPTATAACLQTVCKLPMSCSLLPASCLPASCLCCQGAAPACVLPHAPLLQHCSSALNSWSPRSPRSQTWKGKGRRMCLPRNFHTFQ